MIQYGGYLYFEDETDFDAHVRTETYRDDFWIRGGYICKRPENFPITFEYLDSWDSHSCGSWIESDAEKLKNCLLCSIGELKEILHHIDKKIN